MLSLFQATWSELPLGCCLFLSLWRRHGESLVSLLNHVTVTVTVTCTSWLCGCIDCFHWCVVASWCFVCRTGCPHDVLRPTAAEPQAQDPHLDSLEAIFLVFLKAGLDQYVLVLHWPQLCCVYLLCHWLSQSPRLGVSVVTTVG